MNTLTDDEIINREHDSILQTYKRLPIVVDYAQGARIFDINGNEYLDFLGGIAVNALGHSHPRIIEAVIQQAEKYLHISNYFYQEPQINLAEKLKKISGYDKIFFSNSGAEANEGALKLARRWGTQNGKKNIFGLSGGFHGRTFGTLSIMDKPLYKDGMGPFLENSFVIEYNNIDQLEKNINENTAAICLEFIQGEGGISVTTPEFISKLIELKAKFNFLIIADEVQAGTGRSGKFFSFEHFNIKPDIITLAKGIGGGLPLGCILVSKDLANVFDKGMHGTTYGGNALACSTGLVVLEELENGLMIQINRVGNYLHEQLILIQNKFSNKVLEVRGLGLIKGLLLNFDANILVAKLLNNKVITNAASGTVLRLVPPLIINEMDVDNFISILDKSLSEL